MTTITRDEWLAELERVMRQRQPDSGGMTAQELADQWEVCRPVALKRLGMIRDRLVVSQRRIIGIGGKATYAPTYRLMAKAAKKR
jgi:hypothetical protein